METIIIQTQSRSTTKLLVELAKKLGEKVQILDKEIAEDLTFGKMMTQEKTGKGVSRESIFAELSR